MLPKWIAEQMVGDEGLQRMPIKTAAGTDEDEDEPVAVAGPWCCKRKCIRNCADQNCCCETLGNSGVHLPRKHFMRKVLFNVALISTAVALIAQIVIIIGSSSRNTLVQDVNWVHGTWTNDEHEVGRLWIGTTKYVFEYINCTSPEDCDGNGHERSQTYGVDWHDHGFCLGDNTEYCKDCRDTVTGQVFSGYFGLLLLFGQLQADFYRRYHEKDINFLKFAGITYSTLGIASNLFMIVHFHTACMSSFSKHFPSGDLEMLFGPGMFCFVLSVCLKTIVLAIHAGVQTPKRRKS